ncbi:unnamed protein product [Thlaspi arvense]|uniref:Nuclear transcription factor Y subunit n=1 Tax=Thlaspi arvense TaxID=13288 RepID=A0AAU9RNW6_THLAR|nr:unnamed protein product [Thlaspi arvense]
MLEQRVYGRYDGARHRKLIRRKLGIDTRRKRGGPCGHAMRLADLEKKALREQKESSATSSMGVQLEKLALREQEESSATISIDQSPSSIIVMITSEDAIPPQAQSFSEQEAEALEAKSTS